MPKLKILCQTAQGVSQTYLSSVVDHHSSSYGDKGWGCGYRNLQMLISSLAHHSIFSERLGITKGAGVPSISRLQGLIEEAWAKGYDVQGCEQLGKKIGQHPQMDWGNGNRGLFNFSQCKDRTFGLSYTICQRWYTSKIIPMGCRLFQG